MRSLLSIPLAALLLVSGAATAPIARAEGVIATQPRAEARLLEWLAAFNSQDEARYGAYVRANAPALTKYIRDDHRYSVYLGGLRLARIVSASDTVAEAELTDPYSDAITRLTIKVADTAPYLVTAADLAPPRVDTRAIRQFATDAQLAAELDARLRAQSADQRFSGVVLVAHGGRTVFANGYGDFGRLPPGCAPQDVAFHSASLGKMLTATAILQLVQQGKVDLDAPLSRYVAEVSAGLGRASVRQLLDHTAGAGDFMTDEVRAKASSLGGLEGIVALLAARDPEFPPGSRWKYANHGYILLGRIVETVSGQSYFDYIGKHVIPGLAPVPEPSSGCGAVAALHTRGPDGIRWIDRAPALEELPTSAGAVPLTAAQLATFAHDLLAGRLLSADGFRQLSTGTVEVPGGKYALGLKDLRRNGLRYVGHGGSAPGTNHEVDLYPESGYVVVVLTNEDPPYGNRIADFIRNRMGVLAAADRAGDVAGP